MNRRSIGLAAMVAGLIMMSIPANAAVLTRSFIFTASQFDNYRNQTAPFSTLEVAFTITYADSKSGFFGAPDRFTAKSDNLINSGPFAAEPIAGYFAPGLRPDGPWIGIGGALNGGNVSLNGTDDFYLLFSSDTLTNASISFTLADGTLPFLSRDGAVREVSTVSAVPEPRTWLTMALGLGIISAALRRRRTALAA